jgi:hypothetical protein
MISGRQFFLRSRPAHENTVSLICIEPRLNGGKGEHVSVIHNLNSESEVSLQIKSQG